MIQDTEQKCKNVQFENRILWAGKFLVSSSTAATTLCALIKRV